MSKVENMTEAELTRALAYSGFVLLAFELVKNLIVNPIKLFYWNTTFRGETPFKTYEEDVMWRHKNEFEACLLYLRDFMEAIDTDDLLVIQALRKHRNELAHDLIDRLHKLDISEYAALLGKVNSTLFKLSNYRARMEIGAEPELQGIDWNTLRGHEYIIFEEVLNKVKILQTEIQ